MMRSTTKKLKNFKTKLNLIRNKNKVVMMRSKKSKKSMRMVTMTITTTAKSKRLEMKKNKRSIFKAIKRTITECQRVLIHQ